MSLPHMIPFPIQTAAAHNQHYMKATYNLVFSVVVIHKRSQIFYCKDPFSIFITATCIGNANEKGEEAAGKKRHITHFEKKRRNGTEVFFLPRQFFLNAVASSFEAARPMNEWNTFFGIGFFFFCTE